jgi:hypothetical protein
MVFFKLFNNVKFKVIETIFSFDEQLTPVSKFNLETTHTFLNPGTYFITLHDVSKAV